MVKDKFTSSYDLVDEDKRIEILPNRRWNTLPRVEVDYDDIDTLSAKTYLQHAVKVAYVVELHKALKDTMPDHPLLKEMKKREKEVMELMHHDD